MDPAGKPLALFNISALMPRNEQSNVIECMGPLLKELFYIN